MVNIAKTTGAIIAIVLGVLFLIIGSGIGDITISVVGGVIKQVNAATNSTVTSNFLGNSQSQVSAVFNILGVALLATGGIFIISLLLETFTEVKERFTKAP